MERFKIIDCIDFESDTKNWKYSFEIMTKKCGKDFIDMIKAMWSANDDVQTEDEFCEMNGITKQFFEKVIKK